MKIQKVFAAEVLDSRGTPTVGATVVLSDGSIGVANAPSGASTGKFEAHEKRDGDKKRYGGKGVQKAVAGVAETIAPVLEHIPKVTVQEVDRILIELDNTKNKEKLGANAMLAVSLAAAKALAVPMESTTAAVRIPVRSFFIIVSSIFKSFPPLTGFTMNTTGRGGSIRRLEKFFQKISRGLCRPPFLYCSTAPGPWEAPRGFRPVKGRSPHPVETLRFILFLFRS